MPHPTKPDIDIKIVDVSMNNLDIGTIWFKDDTFLNTAKGAFSAGGLSFQYTANLSNTSEPNGADTMPDGELRFNSDLQQDAVYLYVSNKKVEYTTVKEHSQSIDLEGVI